MAKKKKANAPQTEDNLDVVYDGIPGADKVTDEDVKPFDVDLNFEDESKTEEIEEEDQVEEVEETEPEVVEEESAEGEEPQSETQDVEIEAEGDDSTSEEGTDVVPEGDTRESEEPAAKGADEEAPKEPMIPKSRFDEVLAKQKALQKQLEEANSPVENITEAPEYDFNSKELEYQEYILNGDTDKATQLRNEMREAEKRQMMYEVQAQMGQTVQKSTEAVALQAKAVELQTKYPELDEASATFNQELQQEIMDLRDAFMIQGFTGADALEKAANYIIKPTTEVPAVEEKKADPVQKKVAEKKKVANTTKKIEAAESQPPEMKGKNKVDKKVDIDLLSTDEFDALPDETLRRMRGDFG